MGKLMFAMIGAVVQTPPHFHRILSSLGPKIYFFTSYSPETTQKDILDDFDLDDFEVRKGLVHDAVISYLTWLEVCPSLKEVDEHLKNVTGDQTEDERQDNPDAAVTDGSEREEEGRESKRPRMIKRLIEWNKIQDDQSTKQMIANLAIFLAKVRGSSYAYQNKVMTSLDDSDPQAKDKTDPGGAGYQYEYAHSKPIIEKPKRAATVLRNIAIAHAFELFGRDHITPEDLPILVKIVLSSANTERILVMKALLLAKENISGLIRTEVDTTREVDLKHLVSTSYLVRKTGISKSQIHRIVTELNTLGLIDIHKAGSRHENHMVFKSEIDWVYEKPFQDLLDKCYPPQSDTKEGE